MFSLSNLFVIATAAASLLGSANATPIKRIVPISECTTIRSGTLRASNGHKLTVTNSSVTFGGAGTHVEFQSCQPNFGQFDGKNGTPTGGHIYVPSLKKCLSYSPGAAIPLPLTTETCYFSDDSGQVFSNVISQKDGKIYFVGATQADRSYVFHGDVCESGYFGVKSSLTSGPASLHCVNDGHILGLNV